MNRRKFVKTMLYFLFGWLTRQETGHRWETANPLEDLRAYDREVRPVIGINPDSDMQVYHWVFESANFNYFESGLTPGVELFLSDVAGELTER